MAECRGRAALVALWSRTMRHCSSRRALECLATGTRRWRREALRVGGRSLRRALQRGVEERQQPGRQVPAHLPGVEVGVRPAAGVVAARELGERPGAGHGRVGGVEGGADHEPAVEHQEGVADAPEGVAVDPFVGDVQEHLEGGGVNGGEGGVNGGEGGVHIQTIIPEEGLPVGGEGHGGERLRVPPVVHQGQQAAAVDPHLGLLQGRRHGFLHDGVAEAGGGARREDQVDAAPPDAEAQQSLGGGEDVDAAPVDDGVAWRREGGGGFIVTSS
ncbi:hypothetical protein EYF80_063413 [Liparis tanakae]|uniref:Uncharacterized protein n=1 Tax=Liparis tanakae TaxID=230148 RepID=A0A4Z2ED12_9TELE|nr:hypothetical protein EYF80_063413 [Liparis tanakae]